MTELAKQTNLPAEVIEAFSSATVTALHELTQFEALPGSQLPHAEMAGPCVVAVMQLLRSAPGSLALVLSVDTAEQLTARYLPVGTAITEELVNDVAGEFANVIAGQAKTFLKGTPYHFLLSLPVVTRTAIATHLPGMAVAFEFEAGKLQLHISLAPAS
jgi:CheY-specific phosphatase CheX